MTKRIFGIMTVAGLAAGLAVAQQGMRPRAGQAQRPGQALGMRGGQGPGALGGMLQGRMLAALNLTDAQKTQARAIFDQARETAKTVREQLRQNRQALQAAVKADDAGQIRYLATQQGTLQGQVMAINAEARAKFRAILTPEQQSKMDEMQKTARERIEQRQQRMQQRRQRLGKQG